MSEPDAEPQGVLDGREDGGRVVLTQRDAASQSALTPDARRRLGWAAGTLVALLGATYVVPGLEAARPWKPGEGYVPFWNVIGRELLGQESELEQQDRALSAFEALARDAERPTGGSSRHPAAPARDPAAGARADAGLGEGPGSVPEPSAAAPAQLFPPYAGHSDDEVPVEVGLEGVGQLDYYYGQLTLTELDVPGAITRASHWGDSVLGGDGVTHAIRKRLQARFGDAGHGFMALGRYNLAYSHRGVRFADRGGWRSCEIIFKCESDGHYGYAGVSTRSSGGGTSRYRTAKEGVGSNVSRFELWYAVHPEGGRFQIKVDDEVRRTFDTRAPSLGSAVEVVEVEDGEHGFEVRAIGDGVARGFGVVLERAQPGVVWDELSLIGAFTQRLDYQDPEHIAWQVRRRDVDLMVFMFGGNDVQRQKMDLYRTMEPYEQEYANVLRKFRAGKPEASCLVMSLVDHAERVGKYGIETRRIVPQLVASQRKVALAAGCAFFNTFEAMGGRGSIGRWYHANPRLANADFAHPTVAGQEVIATLLYRALMQGYADYRRTHVGRPLPELGLVPPGLGVRHATDADAGR